MFGREKTPPAQLPAEATPKPGGKGHATPTRRQAEAANKRPLVPENRKVAGKTAKAEARQQRDVQYQAMVTGDDTRMPPQHRGPVRRFLRDSIDCRRTMAEFAMPVALLVLIAAMLASGWLIRSVPHGQTISIAAMLLPYAFVAVSVVDTVVRWRRTKAEAVRRFGQSALGRGTVGYYVARIYQPRRLRMPKPQLKLGEPPR